MISSILPTGYSQAVVSLKSQKLQHQPCESPSTNQKQDCDCVQISQTGKSLSLGSIKIADFPAMFPTTLDGMMAVVEDESRNIEKKLSHICRKYKVSSSASIDIKSNIEGQFTVKGAGLMSEAIAKEINEDKELKNSMAKVAAISALHEAAEKHIEFSKSYAKDPKAAVQQYAYLLQDKHGYGCKLTFADHKLSTDIYEYNKQDSLG